MKPGCRGLQGEFRPGSVSSGRMGKPSPCTHPSSWLRFRERFSEGGALQAGSAAQTMAREAEGLARAYFRSQGHWDGGASVPQPRAGSWWGGLP